MQYPYIKDEEFSTLQHATTDVIALLFRLSTEYGSDVLIISKELYSMLIQHPMFKQMFLRTAKVDTESMQFKWQGITVMVKEK